MEQPKKNEKGAYELGKNIYKLYTIRINILDMQEIYTTQPTTNKQPDQKIG
jgi:hypothetical protein